MLAAEAGVTALSLTDHDTTAGLDRFFAAAKSAGVQVISGVELSADFAAAPLHILGYGFDPKNAELERVLAKVRDGRAERNSQILEKLNRLGYELTFDDVAKHAGDTLIGRPHFAAALVERGYFKNSKKIFQQLLSTGRAAYVDRRRLSPERCVELISNAGGAAVIAHPGQMDISTKKLQRLIEQLIPCGLAGIEVWHSSHKDEQIAVYQRLCETYHLTGTGGSDFHGTRTPYIRIGTGYGSLEVPEQVLENLQSKVKSLSVDGREQLN